MSPRLPIWYHPGPSVQGRQPWRKEHEEDGKSGALVFSTGTNYWARGLAFDATGQGNPDLRIQQTTTNVLADMTVQPQTPA